MERINVIGTSGSGKSTFSRQLAERLGVPCLEMDRLYWKPNWGEPDDAEYFADIERATAADRWVLDGNYSRSTPVKWARVDTVIWLDHSFLRTLFRITKRSFRRARSRREVWPGTGNVETLRRSFASRESVVLWMLTSYRRNRKRYAALLTDPEYAHLRFVRLRSPREVKRFLDSLDR